MPSARAERETNMSNHQYQTPPDASAARTLWPQKDLTLHGHFVDLTPLEYRDTDQLWPIVSSPEVTSAVWWTFLHTGPWTQYQDFDRVVRSRIACQDGVFYAIVDKRCPGQPQRQGWIGLRHIDVGEGKGDLGIFLPSPSVQRTVVATEAVCLLLNYAFDSLGFECVKWSTDVKNEASKCAAKRIGFVLEKLWVWDDVEMISYILLRSHWVMGRKALETWLNPLNFDESGVQRQRLWEIRQRLSTDYPVFQGRGR